MTRNITPASIHSTVSGNAPLTSGENGSHGAGQGPDIGQFKLANGLEVVVIPDHRAPVVTHMIWYRNGSADDPLRKSGIAHFLEHLMFKGTKKHPKGAFSDAVAELGGQENAFTSYDFTAYYQRVPKEHLPVVMEFESDRMTNLVLTDEVVAPEREVVLEERRMRTDNDPGQKLSEAVNAALYSHHPYGKPIIGWNHEIETLNREDALAYYQRFYTPENAILIIAGDVEKDHVRKLAEKTYGQIKARGEAPKRERALEPEPCAHRLVSLEDEKVEQPMVQQLYLVPSYATAKPGEGEALEVLAFILGGGPTSALYKTLVVDTQMAVAAGAYYMGQSLDDTRFYLYGIPGPEADIEELEFAMIDVIDKIVAQGIEPDVLARAKTRLIADTIYAQDSQTSLARNFGISITTGLSVEDVRGWPDRIDAVTVEDVRAAAKNWLQRQRSVTGYLLPEMDEDKADA